ncbi:halocyanin domain-containing protein [Halogeometricum sp. S1BR25-6]|uniref:Halocyanin domain-containing protein n=1 Tax=Halogeometricum salsisoli TaxID=2950536 RepID=A0ABU2GHM2_9EURY|nr:halocyanin domain-containing protein [Halogeometricum sp. S1BR25-6]
MAGLAATGLLAGCAGTGDGEDESPGGSDTTSESGDGGETAQFDGFFENVSNYDGVVDETGQDSVTVTVGSEINSGPYGFSPAAVRVSPGTTVTFEWVSDTHNVVPTAQPEGANWEGHPEIVNEGATYTYTFDTSGTYTYVCEPHRSMGMKGAIVVADG